MKKMMIVILITTLFFTSCSVAAKKNPLKQNPENENEGYSVEQAISDNAQLHTIAFNGLAFITGDFGAATFLPPGKVADYFGFQYMRDVDQNGLGHNTQFLTRIANNVLYILNEDQIDALKELAVNQESVYEAFAEKRFPMIKAFYLNKDGDYPDGKEQLDKAAVIAHTSELFELDGLLCFQRSEVVGDIIHNLSEEQKSYLDELKFDDSSTWPDLPEQLDKKTLSHTAHVAVMTYASELFSWYAGSVESDVYFCPERHGTYFGGFYMKDYPAMGNPDYFISTSITGDSGKEFLKTLSSEQRELITEIIPLQKVLLEELVEIRRQIVSDLRRFMNGETGDSESVMALSKRYGEIDGEMSYYYASSFAEIYKTLTAQQIEKLQILRNLDVVPDGAYLYSSPIAMPTGLDTDRFFD